MRSVITILFVSLNTLLIFNACGNKSNTTTTVDPIDAALPHGAALPTTSLSKEDQQKLANAKGIVATPLHVSELVHLMDNGSNGLNIYCIWKLENTSCDTLLESLSKLRQEVDMDVLAIHHVNTNFIDLQDKVTAHIRELGLINNNYIITGLEEYENDQPYSSLFKSELPILILVNNKDGTKLIYQQAFTFDELYALILPLTI